MDRRVFEEDRGRVDIDEGFNRSLPYHNNDQMGYRRSSYHGGGYLSDMQPMDLPVDDINGHISLQYHDDPLLDGPLSNQYHPSYGDPSLSYEQSMMLQHYPFAAYNIRGSQYLQNDDSFRGNYLTHDQPNPVEDTRSLINSSRYPPPTNYYSSSRDYSSSNYLSSYEPSGIASMNYRPMNYRPPVTANTTVQYPQSMYSSNYSSFQYSEATNQHPPLQQSDYMSSIHPSEATFRSEYQFSQSNSEYPPPVGSSFYNRQTNTVDDTIILPSYASSSQRSRNLGTNTSDAIEDSSSSVIQSLPQGRGVPRPTYLQQDITGVSMITRSSDGGFA